MQAVLSDRVDARMDDATASSYFEVTSKGQLVVLPTLDDVAPLGMAIAKDDKGTADMMVAALSELFKNGTYQPILEKYGMGKYAIKEPYFVDSMDALRPDDHSPAPRASAGAVPAEDRGRSDEQAEPDAHPGAQPAAVLAAEHLVVVPQRHDGIWVGTAVALLLAFLVVLLRQQSRFRVGHRWRLSLPPFDHARSRQHAACSPF